MKKLLLLLYFLSFCCFSQTTTKEQRATLLTFVYLRNQVETLKYIASSYPKQLRECQLIETKFAKKYGIAHKNIQLKVKEIYGDNFEKYLSSVDSNLHAYFDANKMTLKESVNYMLRVKQRANGFIESPILETLIKYQQSEVNNTYSNVLYQAENYTQGNRIKFSVEIPSNWEEIDGTSSSILKMFRNSQGVGNQIITIYKFDNSNAISSFSEKMLMHFVPKTSFNVLTDKKIINDRTIDVVKYEEVNLSRSSNQRRITSRFLIIKENAIILIDHSVYGEKNENLHTIANKLNPSIESILKSVKISSPLQKKNMIATITQH